MRQLDIDEIGALAPARLSRVHRAKVIALGEAGMVELTMPPGLSTAEVAVGDWVLIAPEGERVARVLERKSHLQRRAAGEDAHAQLIAANVDTLFIVTSANDDFNPARLERYLALAHAGGVAPVLVITKADLCDDPAAYLDECRRIAPDTPALALDARDTEACDALSAWCGLGQTVALLGSSGVGKSTMVNSLTGAALETQTIREDDAKGRHTTTARSLHRLAGGGWLIDTPGMRALRLAGVGDGIDAVFSDVTDLAVDCRFSDCQHDTEPGCAVQAAIGAGELAAERLERWQKLKAEDERNARTIAQAHARNRAFGRMVKQVKRDKGR